MSLFRVPVSLVALWWVTIGCINCSYDWFDTLWEDGPGWAMHALRMEGACPPIALIFGACALAALIGTLAAWLLRRKMNLGSHIGYLKPSLD